MVVCGEASNAAQAVELAGKFQPAVAILDLQLSDVNGASIVGQLRAAGLPVKIIMFPQFDERYAGTSAPPKCV